MVASGSAVVNARYPGQVPLDARVVSPGLMVMAVIYFMGIVSGAFPWRRVPGYLVAQVGGAVVSALCLRAMFGNVAHLGATLPGAATGQ
ncbi:MAG TPA: hypothetical protein VHV57_06570 [Acidimicrobiales bacterium]|nr:hypothetical protein [Acidimicrobiales bacterium]